MKKVDIEIGKSYRTERQWPIYGAKVRVLEKDVPLNTGYRRSQPGVRVVVERSVGGDYSRARVGKEHVLLSRAIVAPWTDADDADTDAIEARRARLEALKVRVRGLDGVHMFGESLNIDLDHADEFLDRAGVPR